MTTRSEHSVTVAKSVDQVYQALTAESYWAYIAENLSTEPGTLHEFSATDSQHVATLFEVLPQDLLPEAVRAMISQALKLKRVVTVGELAGDAFSADYTADVKGTPVDFSGQVQVQGTAQETTFDAKHTVSVNIPFMGGALEPKVMTALTEMFEAQGKLTEEWIAANL